MILSFELLGFHQKLIEKKKLKIDLFITSKAKICDLQNSCTLYTKLTLLKYNFFFLTEGPF